MAEDVFTLELLDEAVAEIKAERPGPIACPANAVINGCDASGKLVLLPKAKKS